MSVCFSDLQPFYFYLMYLMLCIRGLRLNAIWERRYISHLSFLSLGLEKYNYLSLLRFAVLIVPHSTRQTYLSFYQLHGYEYEWTV